MCVVFKWTNLEECVKVRSGRSEEEIKKKCSTSHALTKVWACYPWVIYLLLSSLQWSVYSPNRDTVVFTSTVIKFILFLIPRVGPAANVTAWTTTLAARKKDKLLFFLSLTHTHTHNWPWIIRLVHSCLFLCLISPTFTVRSANKQANKGVAQQHRLLFAVIYFVPSSHHRMLHARCCLRPEHILSNLHATFRSLFFFSSFFFYPSQRGSSKKQVRVFRNWLVMWLQWRRSSLTAQLNV